MTDLIKRTRRAMIALALLAVGALTFTACRMEPKGKDVDRVEKACGPEIAHRYSQITWVDRDYASDNILITCILFPGDTLNADRVRKDQVGG